MWTSWRRVGAPMKDDYARMVTIANEGARNSALPTPARCGGRAMTCRRGFRQDDRAVAGSEAAHGGLHLCPLETRREIWRAVRPKTGDPRPTCSAICGRRNMGRLSTRSSRHEIEGDLEFTDIGDLLRKGRAPLDMVKAGENFYSSLGFAKLSPTPSGSAAVLSKPRRPRSRLPCPTAWDVDNKDDIRIKMCIKVNSDDFVTIHHELGHNYYQRAYNKQPFLYLNGANDGFHEAIGDFIALSITRNIWSTSVCSTRRRCRAPTRISVLLRQAMDKVAFLPFGLLVDRWRWGCSTGRSSPPITTRSWTQLRLQYQGITPPVARPDTAFDPGAKYRYPRQHALHPLQAYWRACCSSNSIRRRASRRDGRARSAVRCLLWQQGGGARAERDARNGRLQYWPNALGSSPAAATCPGKAMMEYFAPAKWLDEQGKASRRAGTSTRSRKQRGPEATFPVLYSRPGTGRRRIADCLISCAVL